MIELSEVVSWVDACNGQWLIVNLIALLVVTGACQPICIVFSVHPHETQQSVLKIVSGREAQLAESTTITSCLKAIVFVFSVFSGCKCNILQVLLWKKVQHTNGLIDGQQHCSEVQLSVWMIQVEVVVIVVVKGLQVQITFQLVCSFSLVTTYRPFLRHAHSSEGSLVFACSKLAGSKCLMW